MAQRMLAAVAAVILVMGATMARVSAHATLVRCSIKNGQVEKQHWAVNYQNPKEIDLTLPKLIKEKYYLIWHTQSSVDQHFAAGIVYFQVK